MVALVHQQIRLADVARETQQKNDVIARGLLQLLEQQRRKQPLEMDTWKLALSLNFAQG